MLPAVSIPFPHAAAALVPVCLFLGALVLLDSYKLVRPRWVGYALVAGVAAAALSFMFQSHVIAEFGIDFRTISRYVAPAVEEIAKAALLIALIRMHRIGFQVDAAILGFAVGTGFALAENVYYLTTHAGMSLFTWILRGLGTAMMHGGTTCVFGILSKTLYDRVEAGSGGLATAGDSGIVAHAADAGVGGSPGEYGARATGADAIPSPSRTTSSDAILDAPPVGARRAGSSAALYAGFLPGLAAAYALHSAFNHFLLPPLAMTALIVAVFPLLIVFVFDQSERATRRWLGTGFDTDQAILEALTFGDVGNDPIGRYLQELRDHFSGEIVADMLCLLRLRAELSIKAKGLLMMREAGFRAEVGPDVQAMLDEINYLERSIGPTGMLALAPFLTASARENWQVHLLKAG